MLQHRIVAVAELVACSHGGSANNTMLVIDGLTTVLKNLLIPS